jgi:hypothetical protein
MVKGGIYGGAIVGATGFSVGVGAATAYVGGTGWAAAGATVLLVLVIGDFRRIAVLRGASAIDLLSPPS